MSKERQATDAIPQLPNLTVGDFWKWAYSDILSNTVRGVYAEFLVAVALGIFKDDIRDAWWDYDLSYRDLKIEVKTSGYRQSWEQKQNYAINFDIKPKKTTQIRTADLYVFCLFTEQDDIKAHDRVLDPTFWEFYIVPKKVLPAQKTIRLNPLCAICHRENLPHPLEYSEIQSTIDQLLPTLR